jgi:hypothetical protein
MRWASATSESTTEVATWRPAPSTRQQVLHAGPVVLCWKLRHGRARALSAQKDRDSRWLRPPPRERIVRSKPEDRKVNGLRHFPAPIGGPSGRVLRRLVRTREAEPACRASARVRQRSRRPGRSQLPQLSLPSAEQPILARTSHQNGPSPASAQAAPLGRSDSRTSHQPAFPATSLRPLASSAATRSAAEPELRGSRGATFPGSLY